MMKIIVGLGNPGKRYKNTRHNVGFMTLDGIVKQAQSAKGKAQNYNLKFKTNEQLKSEICEIKIGDERVILAKPMTFMNKSGEAVRKLIENCELKIENLIIVHDDLDIPLGKYKIQFGKGPREHRGVESVEKVLGTKDFWRVRVGIENRKLKIKNEKLKISEIKEEGKEYVLQEFIEEEKKIIDQVILKVVEEIKNKIRVLV